jgi:uncharacterized protein YbaR (Trm112 family)/2-polyprenyl-3-methyl-5-hydroxy-6-metoxy-1,4-benzoquinol methylase
MRERLMEFLVCPQCRGNLTLHIFARNPIDHEIETGVVQCAARHTFPIVGGIPRMLPDSLAEHPELIETHRLQLDPLVSLGERMHHQPSTARIPYDRRTKASFTCEWKSFDPADGTWGMTPEDQVSSFFLHPLEAIEQTHLATEGTLLIDVGCGPGLPSLGYAKLGIEVIALDLSSGLEHGEALRRQENSRVRERVHFVQGDLLLPPVRFSVADIVSSLGVISNTPNTKAGFDSIARLLKEDGVLSVWVYSYERGVTELVNGLRAVTTRLPTSFFAKVATAGAPVFQAFCWLINRVGIRDYDKMSRKAATIALMDILGAPYCHWHTYRELESWFDALGFSRTSKVAVSRRGFGAIGLRGRPGWRMGMVPTPAAAQAGAMPRS